MAWVACFKSTYGVDIDSRILRVKISLILKSSMEKLLYASQIKLGNEMGVKGSEEILSISQIWNRREIISHRAKNLYQKVDHVLHVATVSRGQERKRSCFSFTIKRTHFSSVLLCPKNSGWRCCIRKRLNHYIVRFTLVEYFLLGETWNRFVIVISTFLHWYPSCLI